MVKTQAPELFVVKIMVAGQANDLLDLLCHLRGGQENPTRRDDAEVAERTRANVDERRKMHPGHVWPHNYIVTILYIQAACIAYYSRMCVFPKRRLHPSCP